MPAERVLRNEEDIDRLATLMKVVLKDLRREGEEEQIQIIWGSRKAMAIHNLEPIKEE